MSRTFRSKIDGYGLRPLTETEWEQKIDRDVFSFRDYSHYLKWFSVKYQLDGLHPSYRQSVPKDYRRKLVKQMKHRHKKIVHKAMRLMEPDDLHLDKMRKTAAHLYW